MSKPTKKEKRQIPVRTAGETILKPEDRPSKILFDKYIAEAKAESNTPTTTPHYLLLPPTTKNLDISPKRDYTKVANSINRDAVPSGLFKGTSKNTYDVLYQRTRGAINPKRSIKAVQSNLLLWTNLSHNSLRSHLKHLQSVGLVRVHYKLGDNSGAEYEIFLPEEINSQQADPITSYHPLPPPTAIQNLVGGTYQNVVVGGGSLMPENIEDNQSPKTSLKTNIKTDDESARVSGGFSVMAKRFDEAVKKLTGKGVSKNEAEKWGILAELLILELETAAKRSDSISSVPAFLTEVLRRKLMGANAANPKAQKAKPDVIGKPNKSGSYEIKPLDEAGREAALEQLQEFADDDFLRDFEKWYTPGDWIELMAELKKDGETKTDKQRND
jgi:hypothetical protein